MKDKKIKTYTYVFFPPRGRRPYFYTVSAKNKTHAKIQIFKRIKITNSLFDSFIATSACVFISEEKK